MPVFSAIAYIHPPLKNQWPEREHPKQGICTPARDRFARAAWYEYNVLFLQRNVGGLRFQYSAKIDGNLGALAVLPCPDNECVAFRGRWRESFGERKGL
jgi:hypothetical protein